MRRIKENVERQNVSSVIIANPPCLCLDILTMLNFAYQIEMCQRLGITPPGAVVVNNVNEKAQHSQAEGDLDRCVEGGVEEDEEGRNLECGTADILSPQHVETVITDLQHFCEFGDQQQQRQHVQVTEPNRTVIPDVGTVTKSPTRFGTDTSGLRKRRQIARELE